MPHHRRSIRLPRHDYRASGAYVVTVCTAGRAPVLSRIASGGCVLLTGVGERVVAAWALLPAHLGVALDAFVVMSDHVHGLLWMTDGGHASVAERRFGHPPGGSLHAAVGAFKSTVTRTARHQGLWLPEVPLWQRGFYESVIRSEAHLAHVRHYIADNPHRWLEDAHRASGHR